MTDIVLQASHLVRQYVDAGRRVEVLRDVSLEVRRAEMVAIIGASGSGKSTLLHCLGLLDLPDGGEIFIEGRQTSGLSEVQRSRLRNRSLGFVYQFHHLLAEFSALDNVAMPLIVRRMDREQARAKAMTLIRMVGLEDRVTHYPGQLSGVERQRIALARALVGSPACVLADEPTGNLDRHTAHQMFDLLKRVIRESGTALVVVTHDRELAALADRQLLMQDGQLVQSQLVLSQMVQSPG